jgi:hypothetical protein
LRQDEETWPDAESTVPSISSTGAVKRRLSMVIDDSLVCRTRSTILSSSICSSVLPRAWLATFWR